MMQQKLRIKFLTAARNLNQTIICSSKKGSANFIPEGWHIVEIASHCIGLCLKHFSPFAKHVAAGAE